MDNNSNKYMDNGSSNLSDDEYDLSQIINGVDPYRVLTAPSKKGKVLLPQQMGTTFKIYSTSEYNKWLNGNDNEYVKISPKLDGYAATLHNNHLYTRGDGVYGTDITHIIKNGLVIEGNGDGIGELVINAMYFRDNLSNIFANHRNVLASIISNGELSPEMRLAFEAGAIRFIQFGTLNHTVNLAKTIMLDAELTHHRDNCDYVIDGIVIEFIDNDVKRRLGIGDANKTYHSWQVAYKKNTLFATTTITNIIPQIGKTGKMTPVVYFEPIKLNGSVIECATGNNYEFLCDNNYGIGSIVMVTLAGDIIPKIIKLVDNPRKVVLPKICKHCNHNLDNIGKFIVCTNKSCLGILPMCMRYFFKTIGDINGFGLATCTIITNNGFGVTDIFKYYNVDWFKQLGFGDKQSLNLTNELDKLRTIPKQYHVLLSSIGIPNIGKTTSKNIVTKFGTELFNLSKDDVLCVDDVGEVVSNSIISGLKDNKSQLDYLTGKLNIIHTNPLPINTNLVFCITGKLNNISRRNLIQHIESKGYSVDKTIKMSTTHLINNDIESTSAKNKLAIKNNVCIITENDAMELI